MGDTVVVYAGEQPPDTWQASIFVAGPMPRDPDAPSWRPEVLRLLAEDWKPTGTLVVFVPEARDRRDPPVGYISQTWEERWMAVVDVILFWIPRNMTTLPGLNTNIEYGRTETSGRVVLGLPPEAVSVHYLRRGAETHGVPVRETLPDTVTAALDAIGDGAQRHGPERDVPLLIWRTAIYQTWRTNSRADLLSAQVLWAWSPAPDFDLIAWSMKIETASEGSQTTQLLIASPGHDGPVTATAGRSRTGSWA